MKYILSSIVMILILAGGFFVFGPSLNNQQDSGDEKVREHEASSYLHEEIVWEGVSLVPREILEDSRCPVDVTCIQAGTVRVRATLTSGLGVADQVFELNVPVTTEAEEVTLVQVLPAPLSQRTIATGEYVFYFQIKKR